jgi:DNA repair protein RecO (recombination protein O)
VAVQKTTGIVLKSWDFTESSKIVNFITSDWGQLKVLAKGARRPDSSLRGKLELFNHGLLIFYPSRFSDLHLLSQFDLLGSFPAVGEILEKAALFYYLAELVASASFGKEQSRSLYTCLLQTLEHSRSIKNVSLTQVWFELHFLRSLGVFPSLERCSRCEQSFAGQIFFSRKNQGWLCSACRGGDPDSFRITAGVMAAVRYLQTEGIAGVERLRLSLRQDKILRMVNRSLIDTHLDKRLKSLRFLEHVIHPSR